MFSIGRYIYDVDYIDLISCILINFYQIGIESNTITKKLIHQTKEYDDYHLAIQYDNYIVLKSQIECFIVFNGRSIYMQDPYDDTHINDITYIQGMYYIFCQPYIECRVFVNEIATGNNIIAKTVLFYDFDVVQSQDGDSLLLWVKNEQREERNYVIPMEAFINLLLKGIDYDVLEKYKIDVRANINWCWITNETISNFEPNCQIYDIVTKNKIDIFDPEINNASRLIFIKGAYYIFLKTKIVIVKSDSISKIPNQYNLIEYNHALDLFINLNFELYKYFDDIDKFVRLFVGDYERDHVVMPHNVQCVIECLFECGVVFDIANEIYGQLLKLDFVNIV